MDGENNKNMLIILGFLSLFFIIYSADFSGISVIFAKKIFMILIAIGVGLLAFNVFKNNEDFNKDKIISVFIMIACLIVVILVGKNLTIDVIKGPQTTIISNCYFGTKESTGRRHHHTMYFLCGESKDKGHLEFYITSEQRWEIDINKNIKVTYFESSNNLIDYEYILSYN